MRKFFIFTCLGLMLLSCAGRRGGGEAAAVPGDGGISGAVGAIDGASDTAVSGKASGPNGGASGAGGAACGTQGEASGRRSAVGKPRPFPQAVAPSVMGAGELPAYLCLHFWDRFLRTDRSWPSDSLHLNGVALPEVAEAMSAFGELLLSVDRPCAEKAVIRLFGETEKFQKTFPEGGMYRTMVGLLSALLYGPNSDFRDEDLYLPFVERAAASSCTAADDRYGYEFDASLCRRNRIGTVATDFRFTEADGSTRRLRDLKADHILLYFNNPDCADCGRASAELLENEKIAGLLATGKLIILNLYIDGEMEKWRRYAEEECPRSWICGYNTEGRIREELTYNVRAIPCLYLLDGEGRVQLKDAPLERILRELPPPEA